MSRLMLQRKGVVRAAAISAAGLLGAMSTSAFGQSMTINLQLAPGAAGAGGGTVFIDPTKNNTPINVYVYGTVSETGTGLEGVQYAYYNINNQAPTVGSELTGGVTSALVNSSSIANFNGGLELGNTSPSGLTGNGAQNGALANSGGVSVGGAAMTAIAKPRAAGVVWDSSPDGTNIYTSGTSASFLLETLQFTPTAFNASTLTSSVRTTLVPNIPNLSGYVGANYFTNATSVTSPPSGTLGTTYTAGSTVTVVDTLLGDTNDDGKVDGTDLGNMSVNFLKSGSYNWSQGDFNSDTKVDGTDLGDLSVNFLKGSQPLGPDIEGSPADEIAGPSAVTASVPEPASLSLLGLAGLGLLRRRRGIASS